MPAAGHLATPDTSDLRPTPARIRLGGWTVDRQRAFLIALAESGSITHAAAAVGLSARSAYRLRARADAEGFGVGWDEALRIAAGRLTTIAVERAITGRVRRVVEERRAGRHPTRTVGQAADVPAHQPRHRPAGRHHRDRSRDRGKGRSPPVAGAARRAGRQRRRDRVRRAGDLAGGSLPAPTDDREEPLDLYSGAAARAAGAARCDRTGHRASSTKAARLCRSSPTPRSILRFGGESVRWTTGSVARWQATAGHIPDARPDTRPDPRIV